MFWLHWLTFSCSAYPMPLTERLSFSHCTIYSCLLCQGLIDCRYVALFLGFLFCSIALCLFLCQYHTVLITVALYFCLKSGMVMFPSLFFFRIPLETLSLLWSHMNFRIICSSSVNGQFDRFYSQSLLGWLLCTLLSFSDLFCFKHIHPNKHLLNSN